MVFRSEIVEKKKALFCRFVDTESKKAGTKMFLGNILVDRCVRQWTPLIYTDDGFLKMYFLLVHDKSKFSIYVKLVNDEEVTIRIYLEKEIYAGNVEKALYKFNLYLEDLK